jgi:hypothetical protein
MLSFAWQQALPAGAIRYTQLPIEMVPGGPLPSGANDFILLVAFEVYARSTFSAGKEAKVLFTKELASGVNTQPAASAVPVVLHFVALLDL